MALAKEAIYMEHDVLKENVGVQDQMAVAMGGLNCLKFSAEGLEAEPLVIDKDRKKELNDNLMMFFTGISRSASSVADEQVKNTPQKSKELLEMANMVETAKHILFSRDDINDFGRLLHESWLLKRSLTSKISNTYIDNIYNTALKNGAIGGKLLGAGGGGFILLFVPKEKQTTVKKALVKFLHVPFKFEESGTKVVYFNNY